jgi:hypothetical protein
MLPLVRIVIAGGSGFLGQALQAALRRDRHSVGVLTRWPKPGAAADLIAWTPDGSTGPWIAAIDGADALINLAGEGIADARWSDARKQALRSSRLLPTQSLVAAMRHVARPPGVFVSSSAVGYYGARGNEAVTEHTPPGSDFLSELCVEWERAAEQASSIARVALVRTGLVLHPNGGALAKMLLPFRLGLGGPFGSGRQHMPWIHLDDWVALVMWLATGAAHARGAFNGTASVPVTNRVFALALGRALSRPAILPVPALALRLLLGEFAVSLLSGQRAIPARAEEMGFTFRFREIDEALEDLL